MANPMYRQIAEDLREQIESGELGPGQQLPTELELREHYRRLAEHGPGRDQVADHPRPGGDEAGPGHLRGRRRSTRSSPPCRAIPRGPGGDKGASLPVRGTRQIEAQAAQPARIQVEIQQASADLAIGCSSAEGSEVISRHERRFIDGTPWSLQTSFYPMEFARSRAPTRLIGPATFEEGTVQYLAKHPGLQQTSATATGSWCARREAAEAEFFKLPPDGRVDVCSRYSGPPSTSNRQPMRLTMTVSPTDRNQFIVNNGDVPAPLPGEEAENT